MSHDIEDMSCWFTPPIHAIYLCHRFLAGITIGLKAADRIGSCAFIKEDFGLSSNSSMMEEVLIRGRKKKVVE